MSLEAERALSVTGNTRKKNPIEQRFVSHHRLAVMSSFSTAKPWFWLVIIHGTLFQLLHLMVSHDAEFIFFVFAPGR